MGFENYGEILPQIWKNNFLYSWWISEVLQKLHKKTKPRTFKGTAPWMNPCQGVAPGPATASYCHVHGGGGGHPPVSTTNL